MTACIVARCPRKAAHAAFCKVHAPDWSAQWDGPGMWPATDADAALASLVDPETMADDMARHNARVAASPLPLRP